MHTDGVKAMVGKTVVWIKAVAPNCTLDYCIFAIKEGSLRMLMKNIDKVITVNCISSQHLSTHFLILCDKMESMQRALPLHNKGQWLPQDKVLMQFWVASRTSHFHMKHHFYLKGQVTKYGYRDEYQADILSKMNEVSMSLQGK